MEIIDFLTQLTNPDWIMNKGGLYLVLIILFVETGLFFGFFLPGDPLLFISGMIIAGAEQAAIPFDNQWYNLIFWGILFMLSTIFGNMVGYWTGFKFKNFRLIRSKHLESAESFYQKRGGFAILIARFLPIVRTFIPIVGGMVKMDFKKFMYFNILGAFLWISILTTLGFLLGENPWVQNNLEWTLLALIVFVTAPVIFKFFKSKPVQA